MAKIQYERDVRFYRLEINEDWTARVVLVDEDNDYIEKIVNLKNKDYKDKVAKALSTILRDVFSVEDDFLTFNDTKGDGVEGDISNP